MQITDLQVTKVLNKINSPDLSERIMDYPDKERCGRSDMQVLVDELDWLLDSYEDTETSTYETLNDAKSFLRRSQYGKVVPQDIIYLNMSELAFKNEVNSAKQLVNEYNRLLRLLKSLQKQGYKTRWH